MALHIFSFRKKKKTVFLLKNRQCSPVSPPSPVNVHGDSPTEPAPRGRPGLSHVHCCLSLLLAFSARLPPLPSALSTAAEGPCRNASQTTLTHCSESPPNQTTSHPSQSKPESLSPTCRSWSAWPSPYLRFYTDLFTQRTGRTWPNLRAFALAASSAWTALP